MGDRRRAIVWAFALVAALACDSAGRERVGDAAPVLREAMRSGRLSDRALVEASGVARSTREQNVFWSHNDSGNDERLFALDSTGHALGIVRLRGAANRDWEAIATGPCDRGSCVYVGDVGDNGASRNEVRLFRVAEPVANDTVTTDIERVIFRYVDGPHDVEAMWVTPDTSVFLLTKRPARNAARQFRPARLYRIAAAAWHRNEIAVAELVDSLPIVPVQEESRSWITDAALSMPDASSVRLLAVRTYRDVYLFSIDSVSWRPTVLVATCSLKALREGNSGEAITWMSDGRLLLLAEGEASRVHTGRCP